MRAGTVRAIWRRARWGLPGVAVVLGSLLYLIVAGQAPDEDPHEDEIPIAAGVFVEEVDRLVRVLSVAAGDPPACTEGACQVDPPPADGWEAAGIRCGKIEGLAPTGADARPEDLELAQIMRAVCATILDVWESAMSDADSPQWLDMAREQRDSLAGAVESAYGARVAGDEDPIE